MEVVANQAFIKSAKAIAKKYRSYILPVKLDALYYVVI